MNRFKSWAMLVFSSFLVWISIGYSYYETGNSIDKAEMTSLTFCAIIVILAIGGLFSSMCSNGKTKMWLETVFIFLNLLVWTIFAVFIQINNSVLNQSSLIVDATNGYVITNPNIYFFAYGSFLNTVDLASSWFKQYVLRDDNALTTTQWTFLATSGFIVMLTGISLYESDKCKNTECGQTIFSIAVGMISGIMSSILIPWRSAPLKCQAEIALILLVTWALAIGILTFNGGPAVEVNTMYLGIYLSFFMSLNILTTANYADSVLESLPYRHVEFGVVAGDRNTTGAAGFLDMAYANMRRQQSSDLADDPRGDDESQAMLFESVGGSQSSIIAQNPPSASEVEEATFNKKVLVGRRNLSRIEIWFLLMVESIVCAAVFYDIADKEEAIYTQWIIAVPCASIGICFIGWLISSIQKKWTYVVEGLLIVASIILWIRGLMSVTWYFTHNATDKTEPFADMTANQLFMSYGAFFTSLFLFTNWSNASITTTDWIFFCAGTSVIYTVVTIAFTEGKLLTCRPRVNLNCEQLQWIKLLGVGSALVSFVMILISFLPAGRPLYFVHMFVGAVLLFLWCAGAYSILFRSTTGSLLSPIYFACWGSLFFCVDVATTNLVLLCKNQSAEVESVEDEDEIFEDEDENRIPSIDTNDQDPEQAKESKSSSESRADFDTNVLRSW